LSTRDSLVLEHQSYSISNLVNLLFCKARRDDVKRTTNEEGQQEPRLFSDGNFADPGEMPEYCTYLLSQFEEMLIARVHTFKINKNEH
jgi:hypothetical protein